MTKAHGHYAREPHDGRVTQYKIAGAIRRREILANLEKNSAKLSILYSERAALHGDLREMGVDPIEERNYNPHLLSPKKKKAIKELNKVEEQISRLEVKLK